MSSTSIYRLGKEPGEIGSVRNSWRGAMYVWEDVAKRYCGLERFPMFGGDGQQAVWSAWELPTMPRYEKLVLLSTMDYATITGRQAGALAEAFEQYGTEHTGSSLSEQAEILRTPEAKSATLLAWQQTSVSEFWGEGWDAEKDEQTWYDPTKRLDHWNIITAADKRRSKAETASVET